MNKQIKILLAEDDDRLAMLIQKGLQQKNFQMERAANGRIAQKLLKEKHYDFLITDILMPEMDGIELVQWLRKENQNLPVIMLTALGETNQKLQGFDAGADDYLVKPFAMKELLARIAVLLKRVSTNSNNSSVLHYADLQLDKNKKTVIRAGKNIELTAKELELLQYFLENPEAVLSKKDIAKAVWNTDFDTGTNYIDVYISYLRQKIDKPFSSKLIHTRTGLGFILEHKK